MSPNLPVKLFPLAAKAANSGGLVLAVLIGLALYTAAKNAPAANQSKKS